MSELTFELPGPPVPKARARKALAGNWYTPAKTRKYERAVKARGAMLCGRWDRSGRFVVRVDAFFQDARRRDADNVGKSVLDALNGVAWNDDSQVVSLTVTRAVDRSRPRTVVTVSRTVL